MIVVSVNKAVMKFLFTCEAQTILCLPSFLLPASFLKAGVVGFFFLESASPAFKKEEVEERSLSPFLSVLSPAFKKGEGRAASLRRSPLSRRGCFAGARFQEGGSSFQEGRRAGRAFSPKGEGRRGCFSLPGGRASLHPSPSGSLWGASVFPSFGGLRSRPKARSKRGKKRGGLERKGIIL
jgi:hypothetical protein